MARKKPTAMPDTKPKIHRLLVSLLYYIYLDYAYPLSCPEKGIVGAEPFWYHLSLVILPCPGWGRGS